MPFKGTLLDQLLVSFRKI